NEQMHQREHQRGRNQRRTDKADANRQAAQHDRDYDAEAIAQSPHCDTAQGEARHCKRVGHTSARVMPKSACTNGRATGIDHMPALPMVLTATANPSRRHAAGESTLLSWRSSKSMELPGNEFMTPTSHGPPGSSTLRGRLTNRHDFTVF